jgi:hypothetical protein
MIRNNWAGWLLAGLLLLQNAASAMAAPGSAANPLEGRILEQSSGTFYFYHDGFKFPVQVAEVGDQVIEAIPTATADQWQGWFTDVPPPATLNGAPQNAPAGEYGPVVPGQPAPFPGYS